VRLHIGSAEVLGRVRVLNNRGEIAPGETAYAQLRLETPIVALHDERFIIRSYSPAMTIAGGVVLDPLASKHRGRELEDIRARLGELTRPDRATKLNTFVLGAGNRGMSLDQLAARTGWQASVLKAALDEAQKKGIIGNAGGIIIGSANLEKLQAAVMAQVDAHHRRDPLSRGLAREVLREQLFSSAPPELFREVMKQLETKGDLVTEKELVRGRAHTLDLSPADRALRDKLAAIFQAAQLEPPTLDRAFETAGVPPAGRAHARKILHLLLTEGTLVRASTDIYLHAEAITRLQKLLQEFAAAHEPDRLIDVAAFKELAGVSRKYAIPLLEYLDQARITRRAGDKRIILK